MNEEDSCHVEPLEKPLDRSALSTAMAAYLAVGGLGCTRCALRVRNGLLAREGVLLAEVFLEHRMATVAYDPQRVRPEDLVTAVGEAGQDGRHHYWAEVIAVTPASEALEL